MFGHIFGRFLVEKNLISASKLEEALEYQKKVRVKMGLIAVSEKLLTEEQADKINKRQAQEDKRFGDIAVEQGYLTENQVERLLKLQGNPYLVFVQSMTENGIMTQEEIEKALELYRKETGFTATDIEDLKSGDADRIVPLFIRSDDERSQELAGVAIRTVIRLIDSRIAIGPSEEVEDYEFKDIALQDVKGEHNITLGLSGEENSLLTIASTFAKEEFTKMDLYAFDSVCEFINCVNGLYASALSVEGVSVDMVPPMFYQKGRIKIEGKALVIPLYIKNSRIEIFIAMDTKLNVSV
ncbi:chemotaxis phosphatase CheX-like protein [Kineothrix alysoides]|uniref:Chemotaxis phosphatase CheX-like protein n=1 Tax=Kineothrix alysoides TaxID=1469948 RepID=A0A4V2QBI5_9FIRM|nr:chemotaxis protein CheX [Kineothrix alysoides]TCL56522.1 chemotaxis phosphatase CheX-like protein [Kineothrix alysoides]